MPAVHIILDGDNAWPDLKAEVEAGKALNGELVGICRLALGTAGGQSSVMLRIQLEDGRTVLAQTTLRLFDGAGQAFRGAEARDAGLARDPS